MTLIAVLSGVPLSRPHGVALVLIYPCGKARIGGADAPETGTSLVPRIQ